MRVLLDECLPRRLKRTLSGHEVRTVPEAGWAGKKNGELLRLASGVFDAFVTIDQNLRYQQNLQGTSVAVIVLECRTSRFDDLLPLVPRLIEALGGTLPHGAVVRIGS
jgi:predicted nuclease of predicted toxin-antitoxin system